jgi:hypothetical protein
MSFRNKRHFWMANFSYSPVSKVESQWGKWALFKKFNQVLGGHGSDSPVDAILQPNARKDQSTKPNPCLKATSDNVSYVRLRVEFSPGIKEIGS